MPLCISTRLWKLQGKMLHSTRRSLLNSGKWLGRRVGADFLLPPYNKSMCSFYTERDTEKIKAGGRQEGERRHSGAVYRPGIQGGRVPGAPGASQRFFLFLFFFWVNELPLEDQGRLENEFFLTVNFSQNWTITQGGKKGKKGRRNTTKRQKKK